jgi:hypothetical protein
MRIVDRQASSGPLCRDFHSRRAGCARIALTAVALALICSSCGSSGSSSPGGNPPGAQNNPAVPTPPASKSPPQANPGVPQPTPPIPSLSTQSSPSPTASQRPPQANPAVPPPATPTTMLPAPSPTATIYVPQGQVAKVFTSPSLNSAIVTTLSGGTVVQILCTAQGDTVTNAQGTSSSLWDDTQYGYIPDVNIDTGTMQPVAPACA